MAIRTSCCLNQLLPPFFSPSKTTSQHYSCMGRNKEETSTKAIPIKKGMIIVSLVIMGITNDQSYDYYYANHDQVPLISITTTTREEAKAIKWSQRIRMCPPWHLNSLESIVPENLPRPSAHRGSKVLGHVPHAPPIKFDRAYVREGNTIDCFSM
ncbi:hypothetical protein G4B88_002115 [Cannabis sativa]|uniref:Uncharacterized protein n=2 Tax=Cannabis sativa TaxID=3483 RepID=A0A7J6EYD2_CANSA|nr:hypothetical protein G4B88_002115 [Cannabis sativa]